MTSITALVTTYVNSRAAVVAAATAANQDQAPTIDDNNRMHAPANGYKWDGKTYGAGEYIGVSESKNEIKIKVAVSDREILEKALTGVGQVSYGKSWDQQGVEVSYCYITAPTSLAERIEKNAPQSKKYMMLLVDAEKEGLQHGKGFKFNFRSVSKVINQGYKVSVKCAEMILENSGFHTVPYTNRITKNGDVKRDYAWKGQDVCFVYPNGVYSV